MLRFYLLKGISMLLLAFLLTGCGSSEENKTLQKRQLITIDSELLDESREILISLPIDEQTQFYDDVRYPVIFVLDGESMFDLVVSMVDFLSMEKGNDLLPRSIVVGIPNTQRARDLTPDPMQGEPASGGGGKFLAFLEQELIPFVNEHYPTLEHRTLIGHSYGGLFAIYALLERPDLFDHFVALDPSYQYLSNRGYAWDAPAYRGKKLFVGIANTLGPGETPESFSRNDNTRHFVELSRFARGLAADSSSTVEFQYNYYGQEDHASLCPIATHDALRWLYAWHPLDARTIVQEAERAEEVREYMEGYFQRMEEQLGPAAVPGEAQLNAMAWACRAKFPELTQYYLQQNLRHHPESYQAHFSLVIYFRQVGQRDSAVATIKKALQIRDEPKARAMLRELTEPAGMNSGPDADNIRDKGKVE